MKEKILKKEKEVIKTELTTGETKTETKTETEEIINQETICQNINNLSSSLLSLEEIDGTALVGKRFDELKANLLNAIHVYSTYLPSDENTQNI